MSLLPENLNAKVLEEDGYLPDWMVPDRLRGEPDRAFIAFCHYQALPQGNRSLQAAWRKFRSQSSHPLRTAGRPRIPDRETRCPGSWTAWSVKYKWVKRAAEFDFQVETTTLIADLQKGFDPCPEPDDRAFARAMQIQKQIHVIERLVETTLGMSYWNLTTTEPWHLSRNLNASIS